MKPQMGSKTLLPSFTSMSTSKKKRERKTETKKKKKEAQNT